MVDFKTLLEGNLVIHAVNRDSIHVLEEGRMMEFNGIRNMEGLLVRELEARDDLQHVQMRFFGEFLVEVHVVLLQRIQLSLRCHNRSKRKILE